MRKAVTKCIILGHKNFGENDKLIFLYSREYGKIKAIAKGSKKITSKFTGHLETLSICKAEIYFGPKNILITEIVALKNPLKSNVDNNFNSSLNTLNTCLKIAEIADKLIYEEQQHDLLYELFCDCLKFLNDKNSTVILASFTVKLLDTMGLLPDYQSVTNGILKSAEDIKFLKFLSHAQNSQICDLSKIRLSHQESERIAQITEKLFAKAISVTN